jgi:hypothetical protein
MDTYTTVGNRVVDFVLHTKKRKFDTQDVQDLFVPEFYRSGTDRTAVRRYIEEWLWGLAEPHTGVSAGVAEAAYSNPKAGAIVRKKWRKWYQTSWDLPAVRIGGGKQRHATKALRPPHGRRRAPRKKPMKPQSVKRRWREYDANVREAGKMAATASKPVTGETAKLLLQLGAALKK